MKVLGHDRTSGKGVAYDTRHENGKLLYSCQTRCDSKDQVRFCRRMDLDAQWMLAQNAGPCSKVEADQIEGCRRSKDGAKEEGCKFSHLEVVGLNKCGGNTMRHKKKLKEDLRRGKEALVVSRGGMDTEVRKEDASEMK